MTVNRPYSVHVVIPSIVGLCTFCFGIVRLRQDDLTTGIVLLFIAVISIVYATGSRISSKIDDLREALRSGGQEPSNKPDPRDGL